MELIWAGVAAIVAGMWVALRYLATLPFAPECPICRSVTHQRVRASAFDRMAARAVAADTRECPRCGWSGRMRWRVATEQVGPGT